MKQSLCYTLNTSVSVCPQSQFRFDNECYLNLPDNHKRVSDEPELTSMVDQSMQTVSIFIFVSSRLHLICTLFNHSVTAFEPIRGNYPIIDHHYEYLFPEQMSSLWTLLRRISLYQAIGVDCLLWISVSCKSTPTFPFNHVFQFCSLRCFLFPQSHDTVSISLLHPGR